MTVTKKNIEKLGDGRYKVAPGLFFVVRRGGRTKSFVFRYTMEGREREYAIGSFPGVTIQHAKDEALRLAIVVAEGKSPVDERKTEREAKKREMANVVPPRVLTFAEFYEKHIEELLQIKRYKNPRTGRGRVLAAKKHVLPAIGAMPLNDITPETIARFFKSLWETRPGVAKDLRGHLQDVFELAIRDRAYTGFNPCIWRGCLSAYLPAPQKVHQNVHFKAPTIADLRRDIPVLLSRSMSGNAAATVFGFLTATRRGEFMTVKWEDIDLDRAIWCVPAERRKDGQKFPHRVPLSDQALWLLKNTETAKMRKGQVFTSQRTDRGKAMTGAGARALLKRAGITYVAHGVRSTFRDWAAEQGIDYVAAEKCLMHAVGSGIVRAYLRTDMLEQRRPIMQAWADTILPMETLEAFGKVAGLDAVLQRIGGTRDRDYYRN